MGLNVEGDYSTVSARLLNIEAQFTTSGYATLLATINAHLNIAFETNGVTTTYPVVINVDSDTAPLQVSSTTLNTNLNAEYFNGNSWSDLQDIMQFHNQPDYDSGWFLINAGSDYTLAHNINAKPMLYSILFSDQINPSLVDDNYYVNNSATTTGAGSVKIDTITNSTLKVSAPSNGWFSADSETIIYDGCIRVYAWKSAPWRGFLPDYDTGWFTVTDNTTYNKIHNMSTEPKLFYTLYSSSVDPTTADSDYYVYTNPIGGINSGITITDINSTSFNVNTLNEWYDGDGNAITDGCIRIFSWRGDSTPLWNASTSNTTYHINQTYAGTDYDGSYSRPFPNFTLAFDAIPRILAHTYTLIIHGNYNITTEPMYFDLKSSMINILNKAYCGGNIIITGSTTTATDTIIDCFETPGGIFTAGYTNYGISIIDCDIPITIKNLTVRGASESQIYAGNSKSVTLDNVICSNPGYVLSPSIGTEYSWGLYDSILLKNTQFDITSCSITTSYANGITSVGCNNSKIESCTLTSIGSNGIHIINSSDITISDSTDISLCVYAGIAIRGSYANCSSTTIYDCSNGIKLSGGSFRSIVEDCNIYDNTNGVYSEECAASYIHNCYGNNNVYGVTCHKGSIATIDDDGGIGTHLTGTTADNYADATEFAKYYN